MPQSATQQPEPYTSTLLRVAEYLSRPQQFMAVAEARAAFRHTLERVHQASVVLTTNGEPAAALVPFATLEALRGAVLHLLVREMDASFTLVQAQVAGASQAEPTNEAELDTLLGEAIRRVRSQPAPPTPPDTSIP